MQFKVPQNVQIEDKILPFMTLRQLIISGVGGGFAYIIYLSLQAQPTVVWLPPVAVITVITLAVGFIRINDIAFTQYIFYVIERYLNENRRHWLKSAGDIFLSDAPQPKKIAVESCNTKKKNFRDLAQITAAVDIAKIKN